jgi:HEPN domain-containing protein
MCHCALLGGVEYGMRKEGFSLDDKAAYWMGLSDYDIETAKAMQKTGRYLYVGFMCHQVIEKALKSVIARDCAEGQIPPKIHDLSKLAIRAKLLDKMTEAQQDFIDDLNPLNIEARYPEYKDSIAATLSNEQCKELIVGTEELLCWIKAQL